MFPKISFDKNTYSAETPSQDIDPINDLLLDFADRTYLCPVMQIFDNAIKRLQILHTISQNKLSQKDKLEAIELDDVGSFYITHKKISLQVLEKHEIEKHEIEKIEKTTDLKIIKDVQVDISTWLCDKPLSILLKVAEKGIKTLEEVKNTLILEEDNTEELQRIQSEIKDKNSQLHYYKKTKTFYSRKAKNLHKDIERIKNEIRELESKITDENTTRIDGLTDIFYPIALFGGLFTDRCERMIPLYSPIKAVVSVANQTLEHFSTLKEEKIKKETKLHSEQEENLTSAMGFERSISKLNKEICKLESSQIFYRELTQQLMKIRLFVTQAQFFMKKNKIDYQILRDDVQFMLDNETFNEERILRLLDSVEKMQQNFQIIHERIQGKQKIFFPEIKTFLFKNENSRKLFSDIQNILIKSMTEAKEMLTKMDEQKKKQTMNT